MIENMVKSYNGEITSLSIMNKEIGLLNRSGWVVKSITPLQLIYEDSTYDEVVWVLLEREVS